MGRNRVDRREFLKLEAAAMAAMVGGMPAPAAAQNLVTDRSITELKWNKAPCRFCGTGCGVMVATKEGRVVATHGDTKAVANRQAITSVTTPCRSMRMKAFGANGGAAAWANAGHSPSGIATSMIRAPASAAPALMKLRRSTANDDDRSGMCGLAGMVLPPYLAARWMAARMR